MSKEEKEKVNKPENKMKKETVKDSGKGEKQVKKAIKSNPNVCLKCGEKLTKDQLFCTTCGTKKELCDYCGAKIKEGQKFCSECGKKLKVENKAVNNAPNINKPIVFAILGVIIFALLCGRIAIKVFESTNDLLVEGKYQEAYEKAKDTEKEKILDENMIAVVTNSAVESFKETKSFALKNAWYDKKEKRIVLELSSHNNNVNKTNEYWYYLYNEAADKYELYATLSSLEEETTDILDDYKDRIEKIIKNAALKNVRVMIEDDSIKIKKESIDNINTLFKKEILDDVELLDDNKKTSNTGSKV